MSYEGEMKPKLVASGTEILIGTTVTLTGLNIIETEVGRVEAPILCAKLTTGTITTGSVTVTYSEKIADFDVGVTKTAYIDVYDVDGDGIYVGATVVSTSFSCIKVLSVKNDTDADATAFEVYISGLIK